jgi:hypothetical protein
MGRCTGLWLVGAVVTLWAACAAGTANAAEITCEAPGTGTITSPDQTDTWTFSATAGARVLIDVDGTAGGLRPSVDVRVVGSKTSELSDLTGPRDYGVYREYKLQRGNGQAIRYEIVVRGEAEGDGSYVLRYWNLKDCNWPSIACGDPNIGSVASTMDMDVYQFDGDAGNRILVRLAGAGGFVPGVDVYTPEGDRLKNLNVNGIGFLYGPSDGLPMSGRYTIVVYGTKADVRGQYVLSYTNLERGSEGTLSCTQAGTLASGAAMHVYQFEVLEGPGAAVSLDPNTDARICLHWYPLGSNAPLYPEYEVSKREIYETDGRLPYEFSFNPHAGKPQVHFFVVYAHDPWTSAPLAYTLTLEGQRILKVESGPGGSAMALTDPPYSCQDEVPLVAQADAGHRFAQWTVTATQTGAVVQESRDPNLTILVDDDYTVRADFILVHTLKISSAPGGTVSPAPGLFVYDDGSSVLVAATADSGYRFTGWTVAAGDANQVDPHARQVTLTMNGDYELQANFVRVYTLKMSSAPGGAVTPAPGLHTYDTGSSVPVTATADSGYRFAGWTGTAVDAGKVDPKSPQVSLTMDEDYELQANFARVYSLDIQRAEGGTTTPGPGAHEYTAGDMATVTAMEDNAYRFTGWTGTAVDAGKVQDARARTVSFTMDGDYTLKPDFVRVYNLEILAAAGGTTMPGPGRYEYVAGEAPTVTATPAGGYEFLSWTGTAVQPGKVNIEGNVIRIAIDGDGQLQANFIRQRALPEVSTLGVESVAPTSVALQGQIVRDGNDLCAYWFTYGTESLEFETPKVPGKRSGESFRQTLTGLNCGTTYRYQAWAENSLGRTAGEIRSFTPVALTISCDEGGIVSRPGTGTFFDHEPKTLELHAEPADPGYYFWYWTGSAADTGKVPGDRVTSPDASVYVDANDTLRAMFLRTIPAWDDDVDRPARRGVSFSTSQLWDFGDDAGGADGAPADLYEVAGAAPNGRPPLPGTSLAPAAQGGPVSQHWWATDPFTPTGRRGLLASSGLQARINVWQSHATGTSVWVQVIWHPYAEAEADFFPADAPAELALMDLDPPRLGFRLIAQEYLLYGWRRSTYAWDVGPSPTQVRFTLAGRVAVDSLIVDTYTEEPPAREEIHVDDNASHDPGPGDLAVSDPFEDGTPDHPFDSIQEAIDMARTGAAVVVHPGRYVETINLHGKAITVMASWLIERNVRDASILDAGGAGPAVRFTSGEGSNCILSGLTIVGGRDPACAAILCERGSPTISHCVLGGNVGTADEAAVVVCRDSSAQFINCTITGNRVGPQGRVLSFIDSNDAVVNCIVWGNEGRALYVEPGSTPTITYSDIEGGWPGLGIVNADPLFADPGFWHDGGTPTQPGDDLWILGDYRLRSVLGRLDPALQAWIMDTASSPCLDAGGLSTVWSQEPTPHGYRTDMGVYGGTMQASKSAAGAR